MGICVTIVGAISYSYFNLTIKEIKEQTHAKTEEPGQKDIETGKLLEAPEKTLPPYPGPTE